MKRIFRVTVNVEVTEIVMRTGSNLGVAPPDPDTPPPELAVANEKGSFFAVSKDKNDAMDQALTRARAYCGVISEGEGDSEAKH